MAKVILKFNGVKRSVRAAAEQISEAVNERIEEILVDAFMAWGQKLIKHAWDSHNFWGFTGNTQTSYGFGLYIDGNLQTYMVMADSKPPIIRAKLKKGETVFLEEPYEGDPRKRTGEVTIVDEVGVTTTLRTLGSVKPLGKYGIVVATGTEYSELLEAKNYNVLTETFEKAENESLAFFVKQLRKK